MSIISVMRMVEKMSLLTGSYETFFIEYFQDPDEESQVLLGLNYVAQLGMIPFKRSDKPESRKSAKTSLDHRNAGNKLFMKDNKKAVLEYTASIAAAPYPSSETEVCEELVLAFTNRSAAYFAMKEYEACLRDVEQALQFHAPEKVKHTLMDRRDKCIRRLDKRERTSQKNSTQRCETAFHTDDQIQSVTGAMGSFQLKPVDCVKSCAVSDIVTSLPQKANGQHKHITCASSSVDFVFNSHMGRHIVAKRDIDPGDVLFVEEPFASFLNFDCASTHCSRCLKRSEALIPCKQCDYAMYCSALCRESAWESSHKLECHTISALKKLDVGQDDLLHLPLRMFLNACSRNGGLLELYRLSKSLEVQPSNEKIKGFDQNGQYTSLDYVQLHNLFYNSKADLSLQFCNVIGAVCIFNALDIFTDIFSTDGISDNIISVGQLKAFSAGLILRFFKMVTSNAFAVKEIVSSEDSESMDESRTGIAIYSTVSLLNHSCDPNASSSFHQGDVLAVMAHRTIKKGEGVYISYRYTFPYAEIEERQHHLRKIYGFQCQCEACINQWPEFDDLRSWQNPVCLCQECHTPLKSNICSVCNKKNNLANLKKIISIMDVRINDILKDIKTNSPKDCMSELINLGKTLEQTLERPNQIFVTFEDCFRDCMKVKGNYLR